jgi:hypothetical protein
MTPLFFPGHGSSREHPGIIQILREKELKDKSEISQARLALVSSCFPAHMPCLMKNLFRTNEI